MTLFQYGALTADDVGMSALSLQAYSLGLVAFMLVKVLAPGYYARKDTATPVKIGIIAMVANMVLNLLFVLPLMYFWNIGHLGLALATSRGGLAQRGSVVAGLDAGRCLPCQPRLGQLFPASGTGYRVYGRNVALATPGDVCVAGLGLAAPGAGRWRWSALRAPAHTCCSPAVGDALSTLAGTF